MIARRRFLLALGGMALAPATGARPLPEPVEASSADLLVAVGAELQRCTIDARSERLIIRQLVSMPSDIFYACRHPMQNMLYVIGSNADTPGRRGPAQHFLRVLRIDPENGALSEAGPVRFLPAFANHVTTDRLGRTLLMACHAPSMLLAYPIDAHGLPGELAAQHGMETVGVFAHQVAVSPSNRHLIVCARGSDARVNRAEEPGALTLFDLHDGLPVARGRVGMEPGIGPRNLAFHATRPWCFVGMERGNRLAMYRWKNDTPQASEPPELPERKFLVTTLAAPDQSAPRQRVGAVVMHPNGRTVYVANRNDLAASGKHRLESATGENTVAVFSIDPESGEPALVQHVDTGGIEPRSLALNADGTLLAVGNQIACADAAPHTAACPPASIALFEVGVAGRLTRRAVHSIKGDGLRWLAFDMPATPVN